MSIVIVITINVFLYLLGVQLIESASGVTDPLRRAARREAGMSDVHSCLESQGCHLIPLFYLLSLFFFFLA